MAICKVCGGWCAKPGELCSSCKRALKRLDGYVVLMGTHDQVRWERDVAMKQLEEHGIPFCGIAPDVVKVVRCEKCQMFDKTGYDDDNAHEENLTLHVGYCHVWQMGTQACCFCSHGERKDNG